MDSKYFAMQGANLVLCMRLMEQQNHQFQWFAENGTFPVSMVEDLLPKIFFDHFSTWIVIAIWGCQSPNFSTCRCQKWSPLPAVSSGFESMACLFILFQETQWNNSRSEWEKRRFTVACPEKIKKMISVCWHFVEERPSEHFLMPSIFRFGWWGKTGFRLVSGKPDSTPKCWEDPKIISFQVEHSIHPEHSQAAFPVLLRFFIVHLR